MTPALKGVGVIVEDEKRAKESEAGDAANESEAHLADVGKDIFQVNTFIKLGLGLTQLQRGGAGDEAAIHRARVRAGGDVRVGY